MSAQPETPLFGTVERRLFRATAVLFAIVAMAGLIAGMVWILGLTLMFFYSLVLPLSVAGILALVLNPVVDYIEIRMRVNRVVATSMILLIFVAAIAGSVVMVVPPAGPFRRAMMVMTFGMRNLLGSWLDCQPDK